MHVKSSTYGDGLPVRRSMAFVTDKEGLKPGLIIFRRSDVQHRNWYCRVKVPKADRYKTVSLKTDSINEACTLAWDQEGDVRYAIKHGAPIFNRPFRDEFTAEEYTRLYVFARDKWVKGKTDKLVAPVNPVEPGITDEAEALASYAAASLFGASPHSRIAATSSRVVARTSTSTSFT